MKIIKTECGQDIFVDDFTYDYLSKFKWRVNKRGYAYRNSHGAVLMHRELMNLEVNDPTRVDHKDRNKLNNQLENLRLATQSENMSNREKYLGDYTSKYKGVHYDKRSNKWVAKIQFHSKSLYIGAYVNDDLAGYAYNKKALELFGEFAVLNEVNMDVVKNTPKVYRGVHLHSRDKKWVANGKLKGKVYHLGYHETQKDALEARNKWAKDNNIPIQEWEEFNSEKDTKTDKKKVTTPRKKNGKRI